MSFKSYLKTLFFCLTLIVSTTSVIGKQASDSFEFIGLDINDPKYDTDIKLFIELEDYINVPSSLKKDIIGAAFIESIPPLPYKMFISIRNGGNRPIATKTNIESWLRTKDDKEYVLFSKFTTTAHSLGDISQQTVINNFLLNIAQPESVLYINPDEMLLSVFDMPKNLSGLDIVSFVISLTDSKKIVFTPAPELAKEWLYGYVQQGRSFDFLSAESNNEEDEMIRALIEEILEEEAVAETSQISENDLKEMKENYISSTAEKIRKEWRYLGAEDHWSCNVHVIQSEVGDVLAVNIQNCTIDDSSKAQSFKDSIERAVYKASPLPIAPNENVFSPEILLRFSVN